jgi:hypothetical protein
MPKNFKIETFEEYLARGGKVTKLNYIEPDCVEPTVRSTVSKPPKLFSLVEGADMFTKKTQRKRSNCKKIRIDSSLLPEKARHLIPNDEETNE